ncbi:hypothetical protein U9M48_003791 [Paspalum notatum var. saurae]|uniref:Uncharacterized protein n=1 Tax=Paspalum notatum var. saurae TaxID=547442 RepID=A0AAQ3SE96_PASNO
MTRSRKSSSRRTHLRPLTLHLKKLTQVKKRAFLCGCEAISVGSLRWTGEAGCHRGAPTRVYGAKACEGGFGGFGSKPPPKFK